MKLLSYQPEDRPTAAECLEHPWLSAEADSLSAAPLPSPANLQSKMGAADVDSLGSADFGVAMRCAA
eukprot:scaffold146867_cov33-Prasinocladus_malaysianus.AAC.1